MSIRAVHLIFPLAMVLLLSATRSQAELTAWDQARVTAITKDLARATDGLEETFLKQPSPHEGGIQNEPYYRLGHLVRMLRSEAHGLAQSIHNGDGREQTVWIYEMLMSLVRSARNEAGRAFVAQDVGERAAAVRAVLNQLGPFYDPDFVTLAPNPHIESGATP